MTVAAIGAMLLFGTEYDYRRVALVSLVAMAVVRVPLSAPFVVLVGVGLLGFRRIRERIEGGRRSREDLAALAELTAIGLTGGLGIQASLAVAAGSLGGPIATEVRSLLRQARVGGIAPTMAVADGIGKDLYRTIGRATATGAAMLDQVARIAAATRADVAAERLQAVRRLPVTMLFPLTLLILPGFMLLTIAPALLDALNRLEI